MSELRRLFGAICIVTSLFAPFVGRIAYAEAEFTYTYVVQPGDTLIDIALRHGLSVSDLAAANGLSGDGWVYAGQQLVVPGRIAQVIPSEPPSRAAFITDLRVPALLPLLPVLPQEQMGDNQRVTYARVIQDDAPVYSHPGDAALGLSPKRTLGIGFIWVTVEGHVSYEGREYYQINAAEYVSTESLSLYRPSSFQGIALALPPERPFAWILQPVQPLLLPGGIVNSEAPVYQRYDLVQIFAVERLANQVWYLIGHDQWINQTYVGKVATSAPPEGVPTGAAWVEINLFEQTLAAYVGDRMMYATLVSSGLPGWDTPAGLFQVWLKVAVGKMSGAYNRPDYYFLEDVPWTMYFSQDVALHTAYWHDGFGYKHSHGCVNLTPQDAKWLFEWAPEDLWVWVH